MDPADRLLLNVALEIHEQLTNRDDSSFEINLPMPSWERCEKLHHRTTRAQQLGWRLAAARCRRDLRTAILSLDHELCSLAEQLKATSDQPVNISIDDLFRDLLGLHREFDDVAVDGKAKTISVTTEAIVLEEVALGPFEIKLDWSDLTHGHPGNYRVIAVEPYPATSDSSITHPHVQNETVCEGDGHYPIRNSLSQGRLFDFFTLVANILRTYNSGSPYVELEHWDGNPCRDCGMLIDPDEWYSCCQCGVAICSECYVRCLDCQDDYCLECMKRCARCEDYYCNHCLQACTECREEVCSDCRDDQERCEQCHARTTDEETQNPEGNGNTAQTTGAAIQPDGVGQTAVPA